MPITLNATSQVTHWTLTYFFTHQDPNEDLQREHEAQVFIEKVKSKGIIYGIFGFETCPTTGKLHLQIAFITVERYRWEQLRVFFQPHHIEAMRKAMWRNKRYCGKEGKFIEVGTLPTEYTTEEPTANQLAAEVIKLAKEGKIEEIMERFPAYYMRARKNIHEIRSAYAPWNPIGRKVCIWLYSKEYFRVGKSTFLATHFPEVRDEVYWHPQFVSDFWEGYNYEKTVVFDDLGSRANWLADTLKRITSDTPCRSNQKFGSVRTTIKNIIVSSNRLPTQLFTDDCGEAIAARFDILIAIRHNGRDLLVTPLEKPNRIFPISLISYLNTKYNMNLRGNPEPVIDEIGILGGSV